MLYLVRVLWIALAWVAGVAGAETNVPSAAEVAAGRKIYEEGVLSAGGELVGRRLDGTVARGRDAACVNCHRPSGMGQVEADIQVPPITARFLFPEAGERPLATMDPRIGKRMSLRRPAHTDDTLAAAIREGRSSAGTQLGPLMPRYELGERDVQALVAYLHTLSAHNSPGIEDRTVRFATVITPGVEPARKQVFLDMLRVAIQQKNGSTVVGKAMRRHMVTAAELVLGTENKWALDVWELKGPPETWMEQLEGYYRIAPPFALISGLSNSTWEPVEAFCENERIPCWFPSIPVAPPRDTPPRYSIYFSQGLSLEAKALAREVVRAQRGGTIWQVVRGDDAGARAALDFERDVQALASDHAPVVQTIDVRQWQPEQASEALAQRLQGVSRGDAVIWWLRATDLEHFKQALAASPERRFASGVLVGGSPARVPESLRKDLRLAFPYELPAKREGNLGYMYVWLKLRRIPVVDEAMQSELYFALNFLTDTMAEMLDNLHRDYMLERAENMISQREARKAEDETRDQMLVRPRVRNIPMNASIPRPKYAPGYAEHAAGLREGTTIYPRLSLGPGQRYASKGAYIVRFTEDLNGLLADEPWSIP